MDVVDKLAISDLHSRFQPRSCQEIREILNQMRVRNLRYEQLKPNWVSLLFRQLYGRDWQHKLVNNQSLNLMDDFSPEYLRLILLSGQAELDKTQRRTEFFR